MTVIPRNRAAHSARRCSAWRTFYSHRWPTNDRKFAILQRGYFTNGKTTVVHRSQVKKLKPGCRALGSRDSSAPVPRKKHHALRAKPFGCDEPLGCSCNDRAPLRNCFRDWCTRPELTLRKHAGERRCLSLPDRQIART